MPKLETTVDNLEWKSNKIISTSEIAPDDWTDTQYLSAKMVLNIAQSIAQSAVQPTDVMQSIAHPIGSILTTSTNENPATTLGGTWELVDKAFRGFYDTIKATDWTATSATLHNTSNVLLIDHVINLRIYVNTTVALAESDVVLGKLDLSKYGIKEGHLSSAVYRQPAISDIGNCTACYTLTADGTITMTDVLNVNGQHTAAVGSDFIFNIVFPVGYDKMDDAFCDKFYWKRTA